MFGTPVIVVIEDGWHGNLKMGFFQGHKWEETGVEKNVEFDKPAKNCSCTGGGVQGRS